MPEGGRAKPARGQRCYPRLKKSEFARYGGNVRGMSETGNATSSTTAGAEESSTRDLVDKNTAAKKRASAKPTLFYVVAAVVAGIVGAAIGYSFLGESLAILGIPDPGELTTIGLPFVRSAVTLVAFLGIGSFMMAAFGAPPRKDGYLDLDGYKASRTGTWSMVVWGLGALALVPLYLSDVSGQPLSVAVDPTFWETALSQVSAARVWLWVAAFAFVVAIFSATTRKWIWQPVYFAISILSLIPLGLEGHSASGGNHDYGVNSLLWHLVLTAVWVGGLMALVAHAKRRGEHLAVIVERYSFIALCAIIGIAISGLINAAIRLKFSEWFTTQYGLVITAKAVLTIVLAYCGWLHRRKVIPLLQAAEAKGDRTSISDAQRRPFIRLALVEVLIMAATIGVAVSLSRIPPPIELQLDLTPQDLLLGFRLEEPPSVANYFTMFRLDLVFGVGALILQWIYTWAWLSLKKRGIDWPLSRLFWWTLGNATLFWATSSGLGMYSMAMFSPHMLQHMILSMAVPVFWVLGGPMTLLLRVLPPAGRNGVPGPREWLVVFINNPVSRFLTNPIVAGIQFVIGFYYLYLSSLFNVIGDNHGGHLFMMIHFIISGYIFYWVIIGVDAAPRQLSPFIKMLTLFAVVVFHAWFGIAMMQMATPLNLEFYKQLDFPFPVDFAEEQNKGGGIAWALGEIPLLVVTAAHGVQWMRTDRKEAARHDRREERTGGEELEAYNAMLQGLAEGRGDFGNAEYYSADYHDQEVQGALHTKRHPAKKRGQVDKNE